MAVKKQNTGIASTKEKDALLTSLKQTMHDL